MGTEGSERHVRVHRRAVKATHGMTRQEGLEASARGDVRDALPLLVRALVQHPKDSGALIQLGRCLETAGWDEAAEGAYAEAVRTGCRRTEAILQAARLQLKRGETTEAIVSLESALRDAPGDPWLRRSLARAQCHAGRWTDAERNLKATVTAHGKDWAAHRALVDLHIERGEFSIAAKRLNKLRSVDPTSAADSVRLGRLHLESGAPEAALQDLSIAMDRSPRPTEELRASIARAALQSGASSVARQALKSADPASPSVALALADLALYDGEPGEALRVTARGLSCPHISAERRARLLYREGDAACGLQQTERAVNAWAAANQIWEGRFMPDRLKAQSLRVRQVFSRSAIRHLPQGPEKGPRVVFVVGAPGSGRGLVARILGEHPQARHRIPQTGIATLAAQIQRRTGESFPEGVLTLGERRLRALTKAYIRPDRAQRAIWVDADPNLRDSLGLACLMFPTARVVFVDRDTDDLCLSMLRRPDPSSESAGQRAPADVRALVLEWRRQLAHWKEVLPNRIAHVQYEALVQAPAEVTQQLVADLGLPPASPLKLLSSLRPRIAGAAPLDQSTVGLGARFSAWLRDEPAQPEVA